MVMGLPGTTGTGSASVAWAKLVPLMLAFRVTAAVAAATAEKMTPTATTGAIHHQAALTAQTVDAGPSTDETFRPSRQSVVGTIGAGSARQAGFSYCHLALTSQFGASQFRSGQFGRLSRRQNKPDPISTKKMIMTTVEASS